MTRPSRPGGATGGRHPRVRALLSRARRLAARLDARGVAAVEFALTLPLLVLLYLGGFEAADAAATYRRLADCTVTLANVASQYSSMSAADVQTVFSASAQVMTPYSTSNLGLVLSEISTDASSHATVTWSQSYNGATALAAGAPFTLPSNLSAPSTSYILVQSSYLFLLPTGYAFSAPLTLRSQIFMLPRGTASIPYTG